MTSTTQTSLPGVPTDQTAFLDEAEAALEALVAQCSALTGRPVGLSALVRALAVSAQRQGEAWIRSHLLPIIEAEQQQMVWRETAPRARK